MKKIERIARRIACLLLAAEEVARRFEERQLSTIEAREQPRQLLEEADEVTKTRGRAAMLKREPRAAGSGLLAAARRPKPPS